MRDHSPFERLAFIEQLSGAPPSHRVLATRDGRELYRGREASCRLIAEAYGDAWAWGDDSIGPVVVQPLTDERPASPPGSDPAGA
jgi:hypothetical protein